jgi:glycerophosphoryl diester phosphodiesterase
MLIISHRGYHLQEAENTVEAFEQAVAMGVDGIETDVRLSADGALIVFHDRVAPNGKEVAKLSRNELSNLVGYTIPTLESILDRFDKILWNVEIKTPTVLDRALPILSRYSRSRQILVTSFWHNAVAQVSHAIDVECGLLIAHRPLNETATLDWLSLNKRINTIVWDYEILDPALLELPPFKGLRHFVYGAETQAEHKQCADIELAGVITDHPEFLL